MIHGSAKRTRHSQILRLAALPVGYQPRLPLMRQVEQQYEIPPAIDIEGEIDREWRSIRPIPGLKPGASVAVGVGSRGIAGLVPTIHAVVTHLRSDGFVPFVVPAMGSHGGGAAEGQIEVLASLGVTEASVEAPIRATMDVVHLGEVSGVPLVLDRLAYEADGFVVVNRVKPHTDFIGRFESGLMKMLVIGMGNQVGADSCHRHALQLGVSKVIELVGCALLERCRAVLGVALVENQDHRPSMIRLLAPASWPRVEPMLLRKARSLVPRLPIDDIDLLIVDEMGKEISGAGIDPNVTGRSLGVWGVPRKSPRITRIIVRDLTDVSEGNAAGLGMVDMTTRRLIEKVDYETTSVNALTSCMPESPKVPPVFASDRDAILAALTTVRPHTPDDVRIVHIRNTNELRQIEVSQGCLPFLTRTESLSVSPHQFELQFDRSGGLLSRL